jgi:hypothetical protein
MKKNLFGLLLLFSSLSLSPLFSTAQTASVSTEHVSDSVKSIRIMTRLTEIENMDKSNLTVSEKRALRNEVRSYLKQSKAPNTGVYFSVGAIIIILLLLIILL